MEKIKNSAIRKSTKTDQAAGLLRRSKMPVYMLRIKRRLLSHLWFFKFLCFLAISVLVCLGIIFARNYIVQTPLGYWARLVEVFVFPEKVDLKTTGGTTNILVLGKSGEGHDAPELTDTIMLVVISDNTHKVDLVSLPRDIWVPALRAKLNSVYYWGNQRSSGGGLPLAKATVEEILGIPVHYGGVINLSGVEDVINVLGGIDVNVRNAFTDSKYPVAGREDDLCDGDPNFACRYEIVEFTAGLQKMDGQTVLKFIRSRNAQGDEGTDLARAARQQDVILALRNKLLTSDVIFSPKKIAALKDVLMSSTESDIPVEVLFALARKVFSARNAVNSHVLPQEFLENPPYSSRYDNLYVFIPKEIGAEEPTQRSWLAVQAWLRCVLNSNNNCKVPE